MNACYRGRNTGRTTRMLEASIHAALFGEVVYVVVHAPGAIVPLIGMLKRLRPDGVQVASHAVEIGEHKGRICFVTSDGYDPMDGRVRGFSSSAKVFVDHFVVESKYRHALKQWLMWSEGQGGSP